MAVGGPEGSATNRSADQAAPAPEAVRAQLDRILASPDFAQSDRTKSFLRFVVEEALAGRQDRLKEYTIAVEVFDRDESFDPQTSTIVRVEAGRLRRRLERYYLTAGRDDEVRIDMPKGAYVPIFRTARTATPAQPAAQPAIHQPAVPHASPDEEVPAAPVTPAETMPSGPSIAVLPFENLSGDAGQDFFADGISEEIINALTRFPDLRVISRHSTFKYKGERLDVRDVGKDLDVRYVLEGSVRKAGELVRVTSQLIDATNAANLFSETYDRDLSVKNILEIQDDIADRIVAAVGQPYGIIARAGARHRRSGSSGHSESYDAVLRFYEYWVSPSPGRHQEVRAALERAVELDPNYASAWAALAAVYLDELRFSFNPRHQGDPLDRALEAAQRAVMLEPENSMAYHFLFSAHFARGELDEFKATGERALTLNPNHADMLADYGFMLALLGEWERGVALADKAMALSPTHPGWFHAAALANHYHHGDYEAALANAKQIQMPEFYMTYLALAMCYGQLGRERDGRNACDKLLEIDPDFAENAWGYLFAWNMPDELAEHMIEGLRKAGLHIGERPA